MWTTSRSVRPVDRIRVLKCVVPALLCALAWHAPAFAQDAKPIELKWNAPEGCPNSEAVLARVRQIAGPSSATGMQLRAEGTVTQPRDGDFHLRLVIRAGSLVGVREVDGKSCKDLAGVTALGLAVLLSSGEPLNERALAGPQENERATGSDTQSGAAHPGHENGTPTTPTPTPTPAPVPRESPPESGNETPRVRHRHAFVNLPYGALSVGPLQQRSLGLGLAAGVFLERWRFSTEGTLWSSQRATTTYLLNEYATDLKRLSLGLRGCRAVWGSRLELAPCVTLSVQHLSAHGAGPSLASQTANTTWFAAGVGVQARLFIAPWLSLLVGVDGELETSRPEVELEGIGTVERLSPAATTITLGSEWIL